MKHHLHMGNRGYAVEWLQATFTLLVLTSIYLSSGSFTIEWTPMISKEKSVEIMVPYWNETFGYWFQWNHGDIYMNQTASWVDSVSISSSGTIYDDEKVKVSFYPNATIEDIEHRHPSEESRAYSRLPNGIAVIEWDLASSTAKLVLATLHSR